MSKINPIEKKKLFDKKKPEIQQSDIILWKRDKHM